MSAAGVTVGSDPSVQITLRWIVVMFRVAAWIWVIGLTAVMLGRMPEASRPVLIGAAIVATAWTGVTVLLSPDELGRPWFAFADGGIVLILSTAGYLGGADDLVTGGLPASWLFVVAFVANLRWTMVAALIVLVEQVVLHDLMNLGLQRTVGTYQFLVFGLLAGWSFDALRNEERRRVAAESQLDEERRAAVRMDQGARLGQVLHDSVLQTLLAIKNEAESPGQVRYLARWQERELRRTIEELQSPHDESFRVELLTIRDGVEDLYTSVRVVDVIRDDAALTAPLRAGLSAAREALTNAAKHSGVDHVYLYAQITDGWATIHVRDRGRGFDPSSQSRQAPTSMQRRVDLVGGSVDVVTGPNRGTEVTIKVPVGE